MINVGFKYFDYVNKVMRVGEAKENYKFQEDDPMVEAPVCRLIFNDRVNIKLIIFNR